MWDLDGLIDVSDLKLNLYDIVTFFNSFKNSLKYHRSNAFSLHDYEFTTTNEIYERTGIYGIRYNDSISPHKVVLCGNSDIIYHYFLDNLKNGMLRCPKNISVSYEVYDIGIHKHFLSFSLEYIFDITDKCINLYNYFSDLFILDSVLTITNFSSLERVLNILINCNISASHLNNFKLTIRPMKFYEDYVENCYSLYKLLSSYPIEVYLEIDFLFMKRLTNYLLGIFSSFSNFHLIVHNSGLWNRFGVKESESVVINGIEIGVRHGNEILLHSFNDYLEDYLESSEYKSMEVLFNILNDR